MSVVIRMKRGGRTHSPYYRVVVMDSRDRNRGREIEQIGIYHPCARPEPISEINGRKALEWLYKGAQYSDTARKLLSDIGIMKAYADGVKPEDIPEPEATPAVEAEEVPAVEAEAAPAVEAPAAEAEAATEEAPAADAAAEKE